MSQFKLDPDLQMVPTVKKGQYTVSEGVLASAAIVCSSLIMSGLEVAGDGVHQIRVKVNGKTLFYQMVGYIDPTNEQKNEQETN